MTSHRALGRRAALLLGLSIGGVSLGQVALAAPGASTPTPSVSLSGSPVEAGRGLYLGSCASCHGQSGEGSQRGPSLIGVGAASADFQLSTGRMPLTTEKPSPPRGKPAFDRPAISALSAYVGALGGGPEIPDVAPGDLTHGRELYLLNCAACHSASGVGAAQVGGRAAPSLFAATPTQIAEAIRVGPNLMPRFPYTALDDPDVNAIASYIQALQPRSDRGGNTLGLVGPVTETLVGLGIGVGVLVFVARLLGKRAP